MSKQTVKAEHAVVIGGSIAGLLAARILSETFQRVTIVDRDVQPVTPMHRQGVPQSRHTHGLLAKGFEIFEGLFPGLGADLVDRGAIIDDLQRNVIWYNDGHQVRRASSGLNVLLVSRPTLEAYVRARVTALPGVELRADTQALSLREQAGRVCGVEVAGPLGTEILAAQLAVDATGRSHRGAAWLQQLGYPPIAEDVVRANIVYVSREYRRVPGAQDFTGVIHSHYPGNPVGSGSFATDGQRWIVTMLGLNEDYPSVVPGEFEQFAKRLEGQELYDLVSTAEPITEPTRFRIGPSVRRRYERSPRLPEGFIAIGDSLCCFNPAYGQGMTSAAMSARWLGTCLRAGLPGLTRRYFRGVRRIIDVPWAITVGNDLRFPDVAGPRTAKLRLINAYLPLLHRASTVDAEVGRTFLRVANFTTPPTGILAPRILWRVLTHRKGRS